MSEYYTVPAVEIAYWMLKQALEVSGSMPIDVKTYMPNGEELAEADIAAINRSYWITFSSPVHQAQTLDAILTQLQELGYLVGIDYYTGYDRSSAGVPETVIALAYPRAGISEPSEAPVIELSEALEFTYHEDGTGQSNSVSARAGAGETKKEKEEERKKSWAKALEEGYPLLEQVGTMPAMAKSEEPEKALEAFLRGLLATSAYPLLAPVITLPMFGAREGGEGGLSIFDIKVGDDVLLRIPKGYGDLPSNNPRFPNGLPETNELLFFRIIRIDCRVPDEGVPVMDLTLNLPPKSEDEHQVPVKPPGSGAS